EVQESLPADNTLRREMAFRPGHGSCQAAAVRLDDPHPAEVIRGRRPATVARGLPATVAPAAVASAVEQPQQARPELSAQPLRQLAQVKLKKQLQRLLAAAAVRPGGIRVNPGGAAELGGGRGPITFFHDGPPGWTPMLRQPRFQSLDDLV